MSAELPVSWKSETWWFLPGIGLGISPHLKRESNMLPKIDQWNRRSGAHTRVGMVSTYPPTRCGIAAFSASLIRSLEETNPDLMIDMVRLVNAKEKDAASWPVQMEIDPSSEVSVRSAGRHLSSCDVVLLQHEFGIYGPDEGAAILNLAAAIPVPKIVVLHTVLPTPTPGQSRIIDELSASATLVVMCESARRLLVENYSVDRSAIEMIPHGAKWSPQPANHSPRRQLISWGLLGPGKGLERSIQAIAQLRNLDPPVRYRIVGRTHPAVLARSGFAYRQSLEALVDDMGVGNIVEFVDRYVGDDELFDMIRRSDVVVAPYDNEDQVSSGVITEAVGIGRPVVATSFPYSRELLDRGLGLVVDHDPDALAHAIRSLLDDPTAYARAQRLAMETSRDFDWSSVARRYAALIRLMAPDRATA
jgi:polysaccharide biosynthesis protein PslF